MQGGMFWGCEGKIFLGYLQPALVKHYNIGVLKNYNIKELDTRTIFQEWTEEMNRQGFSIIQQDLNRPWGGFFVIDEAQTEKFLDTFFPDLDKVQLMAGGRLSPKILMVAPHQRLSWQYHFRRAEQWRVLDGPVGVAQSPTDDQPEPNTFQNGDLITLAKGERHRLIGLADWGIVAEIWQHTDPDQPSDESDIVRLQDDFKRT